MKYLFSTLALLLGMPVVAQISFKEENLDKIFSIAKDENKMVFVDCYTSWCGPCKRLSQTVFSDQNVGNVFNSKLISKKMDMEKGEGPAFAKKYDVNAYPTLLILNTEGKVLWRHCGYIDAEKLIDEVNKGVKSNPLDALTQRYESGERDYDFMKDYLGKLDEESMTNTLKVVVNEYFKDKADIILKDSLLYQLFDKYVNCPESEAFQQVYAHKKEYAQTYGATAALNFEKKWEAYTRKFLVRKDKKTVGYNKEGLENYYQLMKRFDVNEAEAIRAEYFVKGTTATKEWSLLLKELKTYVTFSRVEEWDVYIACETMIQELQDSKQKAELKKFVRKRIKDLEGIEDTTGRTMTIDGETMPLLEYFRRSYKDIHDQL